MTNYAFQGVGLLLKLASALAIHLIFVESFWLKPSLFFVQTPQPKGVGLVIIEFLPRFMYKMLFFEVNTH